jgi:hypothetical protein
VRPTLLRILAVFATCSLLFAACGSTSSVIANFDRDWGDGRVETLELHDDGKVLMNHVGTIDRTTLSSGDLDRIKASLSNIEPATDPSAYPRLTLTPTGGGPVVVATTPGTAGELFLSLLDTHRLP